MIHLSEVISFFNDLDVSYKAYGRERSVTGFASLKKIEPGKLYYSVGGCNKDIESSIIISDCTPEEVSDNTYLVVDSPQVIFYRLMNYFEEFKKNTFFGVSERAIVSSEARLGERVSIGSNSVVGDVEVSEGVVIGSNVVIHDGTFIGPDCVISDNSVVGARGVAWVWDQVNKERVLQPQIGGVYIGRSVFIGSNVTLARGSVNENTEIHDGCLISHGSQIGHGVIIHENVHVANNVSIAGNVEIFSEAFVGSGATLVSHVKVAKSVVIGAGSVISRSVEKEGVTMVAMPARPIPSAGDGLTGVPKRLEG